jgi:hypothetical protein
MATMADDAEGAVSHGRQHRIAPDTPPGPTAGDVPPSGDAGDPSSQTDPLEPQGGDTADVAALRREAASWRNRLRDVEADRDQLQGRLDELERLEVERLAANAGMATPGDLWLLVQGLDELRHDGRLSPDLATERIQTILKERPSWRKPTPAAAGGSRLGNGQPRELGLYDLIEQRRR